MEGDRNMGRERWRDLKRGERELERGEKMIERIRDGWRGRDGARAKHERKRE